MSAWSPKCASSGWRSDRRCMALPSGLSAMGVERGSFDNIIKGALADHCHGTNPRIASVQDYEEMLVASM